MTTPTPSLFVCLTAASFALASLHAGDAAAAKKGAQANKQMKRGIKLLKKGDFAAAAEAFETSKSLKEKSVIFFYLGEAYRGLTECGKATANYTTFIEKGGKGKKAAKAKKGIEECADQVAPVPEDVPEDTPDAEPEDAEVPDPPAEETPEGEASEDGSDAEAASTETAVASDGSAETESAESEPAEDPSPFMDNPYAEPEPEPESPEEAAESDETGQAATTQGPGDDGPRFRFGIGFGGGYEKVTSASGPMGGFDIRLGLQLNDLLGVYTSTLLAFGKLSTPLGGGSVSGTTGTFGFSGLAEVTLFDMIFAGAGAGYGVLNNPSGLMIHARAGIYPIQGRSAGSVRRKGLMIGVDYRSIFITGATGHVVMVMLGFEKF